MAFSQDTYFKVWSVSDKGSYAEVSCSTSKKNRQTGSYETDFSSKYVRFVGEAHKKCPQPNESIYVTKCAVQNVYEKNGQKQYLKNPSFVVFDFSREGDMILGAGHTPTANSNESPIGFDSVEMESSDSLPF